MRFSFWLSTLVATVAALLLPAGYVPASADEPLALEDAARKLRAAVVTVRVFTALPATRADEADADSVVPPPVDSHSDPVLPQAVDEQAVRVTVCSGVSLGKGLVVTPIYAAADARIRITLAGGHQTRARVLVVDEYSGLTLLQADTEAIAPLEPADELPNVGAWVLSAAAWGVEEPVVSLGIVSGLDRTLRGATYPPLLQCDLRTTETSNGAAMVDRHGRLIGIIVASEGPEQRRGWAYAVPIQHVQRLLRARVEKPQEQSLVVLKRRRPHVGMVLGGTAEQVVVERVEPDSPAAKAGIRQGDQILAADGIKIRSVYQAVRPILNKQPGDTIRLLVQKADRLQTVEVVLGGGVELPAASLETLSQYVQPKLDIDGLGPGRYVARSAEGGIREVFSPQGLADERRGGEAPQPSPRGVTLGEKLQLLEKALDGYRHAILYQQDQLRRGDQERTDLEATIRTLEAEIERLKGGGD